MLRGMRRSVDVPCENTFVVAAGAGNVVVAADVTGGNVAGVALFVADDSRSSVCVEQTRQFVWRI